MLLLLPRAKGGAPSNPNFIFLPSGDRKLPHSRSLFSFVFALALLAGAMVPTNAEAVPVSCEHPLSIGAFWESQYPQGPDTSTAACEKACKSWVKTCKQMVGNAKSCWLRTFLYNKKVDTADCGLEADATDVKSCKEGVSQNYKGNKENLKDNIPEAIDNCVDREDDCVTFCTTV
jgi:hypothetical protein